MSQTIQATVQRQAAVLSLTLLFSVAAFMLTAAPRALAATPKAVTEANCPACAEKESDDKKKDDQEEKKKNDKGKKKSKFNSEDVKKLAPLQTYVGLWRGVGSPRRGQTEGAWYEESHWQWNFENDRATLAFDVTDGKYFDDGQLMATAKKDVFALVTTDSDSGKTVTYTGGVDDGLLVLTAAKPLEGKPARISIRLVARGKRMVVLLEKQLGKEQYSRLAEVGYTRRGSGFGKVDSTATECVVTGGYATSTITYKGTAYPMCCTGCREMFNDDPEKILAEYKLRKEAEKKKREEGKS